MNIATYEYSDAEIADWVRSLGAGPTTFLDGLIEAGFDVKLKFSNDGERTSEAGLQDTLFGLVIRILGYEEAAALEAWKEAA